MSSTSNLKVAIGGVGAIGLKVAECLDRGEIPGLELTAVAGRDLEKLKRNIGGFRQPPDIFPVEELGQHADVVIECAPKSVLLLDNMELIDRARDKRAVIFVPTGALLGLDAVKAVAEGDVVSITLLTRKPPTGLSGAPYLTENNIDIENLSEPKQVFAGSAREAAIAFPANVNVAAALALAGIGPDRTSVQVWADPSVNRNMHTVEVVSEASNFTMSIENVPSETPATGKITALSVIASLRRLTSSLVVGT